MTDQPSQRAMKGAALFCREDATDQAAIAAQIDEAFPAYLEIREALEAAMPFLKRFAEHCEERFGIIAVDLGGTIVKAEAALAKARKDA